MPTTISREIHLASRPHGWPTLDNFQLTTTELPQPGPGQVLVRNLYMSVDPYMRGRMNDVKSYVPPFQIGQPLDGGAIGTVTASQVPGLNHGDIVLSAQGWREYFVADADQVQVIDPKVTPLSAYLGVLGMPGMTAWVGLHLAELKPGEVIFVSAAAGAVGSMVGQLAKLRGARVIGSAGSDEKVRLLTEDLGFDAAFNYKHGDIPGQLQRAAPEGIDVYFDNVGGDHLEAAIGAMRNFGRIAACGAISQYNLEKPSPGPSNLFLVTTKRLTIKGFIVSDWMDRLPEFLAEAGGYLASGKLKMRETVVEGIERAPEAFLEMLHGQNIGKMVVKLA
jgi:NADPH-dependent curcumin reductase CurA